MILTPFSEHEFAAVRTVIRADLSGLQHHLLDALRANASGPDVRRPDGSIWRHVAIADAGIDGCGRRVGDHFRALRATGLFDPVGVAAGLVLIAHAGEVRV